MAETRDKAGNLPSMPLPGWQSPEQFTTNMLRAFELSGQIVKKIVEDKDKRDGAFTVVGGLANSGKLFAPIVQHWMRDPNGLAAAQAKLSQDLIELWGRTYKRFLGQEVAPVIKNFSRRSAFPGQGMDRKCLLRFPQASLSDHRQMG